MKYYELTKEEEKLLDEVEGSKLVARPKQEHKRFQAIAKNTLDKNKNINIRISVRDLFKLKAKALSKGIPYQTLASSIIHETI